MKDLLNEDEFLRKEYNPRGWFNRFYIISSVLSTVLFLMARFLLVEYSNAVIATIIAILALLTPFIFSMIMVFSKRDNVLMLHPKKAAYKVFILVLYCCLSFLLVGLISTFEDRSLHISMLIGFFYRVLLTLAIYGLIYLITISIIIPILKRAQRINKLPQ